MRIMAVAPVNNYKQTFGTTRFQRRLVDNVLTKAEEELHLKELSKDLGRFTERVDGMIDSFRVPGSKEQEQHLVYIPEKILGDNDVIMHRAGRNHFRIENSDMTETAKKYFEVIKTKLTAKSA